MEKTDLPAFKVWLRAKGYIIDDKQIQWQALRFFKPGQQMYIVYYNKQDILRPDKRAAGIWRAYFKEARGKTVNAPQPYERIMSQGLATIRERNMAEYAEYTND